MRYKIWSIEHEAWWKPEGLGYTSDMDLAGEFEEHEAFMIVKNSQYGSSKTKPMEALVPVFRGDKYSLAVRLLSDTVSSALVPTTVVPTVIDEVIDEMCKTDHNMQPNLLDWNYFISNRVMVSNQKITRENLIQAAALAIAAVQSYDRENNGR